MEESANSSTEVNPTLHMMHTDTAPQHHIVMLPFMSQGHIGPFLSLANRIHGRRPDLAITLVSTPRNIQHLCAALPPVSPLRFHALPFCPADHGLPADVENTDSLPYPLIPRFIRATYSLKRHFYDFIASSLSGTLQCGRRPPVYVMADALFGWPVEVAKCLGVVHATLTACSAYGWACFASMWLHLPFQKTDTPTFHVPGFPEGFTLHRSQIPSSMSTKKIGDPRLLSIQEQISLLHGSDIILCNTIEELEGFGLRVLRSISGVVVYPIGPLLPLNSDSSLWAAAKKPGISSEACLKWLDMHPTHSVIYVAFGSQFTISASQMKALASGLEASGVPFIWVLRPPVDFNAHGGGVNDEWLPEGFEARIDEGKLRGLLVRQWAPQLEILSHRSLGAFLGHCGWNSVLESLSRGVPIIGWPLEAEQFFNSKMVEEELEAGVEIARGMVDKVESDRVEEVIRLVMASEKGDRMREKAAALSQKIKAAIREDAHAKGSSLEALDGFLQTIMGTSC